MYGILLCVHYRYSRLFVDDFEKDLEKTDLYNHQLSDQWIDLVKLELKFGTLERAHIVLEAAFNSFMPENLELLRKSREEFESNMEKYTRLLKQLQTNKRNSMEANNDYPEYVRATYEELENAMKDPPSEPQILQTKNIKFNINNQFEQILTFPKPLIHYLLNSQASSVIQKLYESCKSMFSFNQTIPIIYRVDVEKGILSNYFQQSLSLSLHDFDETTTIFSNLYIANVLNIKSQNREALSNFLPKIKKCTAKLVCIFHQNLFLNVFTFLTSKVKYLYLNDIKIKNEFGMIMSNDEIKAMFDQSVKTIIE